MTFDLMKIPVKIQDQGPLTIKQPAMSHNLVLILLTYIQSEGGLCIPGKCAVLTQVPGHQVGVVEILHAQSDDVDEFFDDLHELHRPRIDLHKRNRGA